MSDLKYSIVIPFYNVEKYIVDCAKSLHSQPQNFEAIFVDDGSPDNSHAVLQAYLDEVKDERMRIVVKENGGVSSARNMGIRLAKGKYLCFVDSDDMVTDNYLSVIDENLEEDTQVLMFDYYDYYNENKIIRNHLVKDCYKNNDIRRQAMMAPSAPWSKVVRRDLLIDNNLFFPEGMVYEDLATILRYVLIADRIKYVEEPIVYYRFVETSIMHSFSNKVFDMIKAIDIIIKYYKEHDAFDLYKDEIEMLALQSYYFILYRLGVNKVENKVSKQKEIAKKIKDLFPNWINNRYLKKEPLVTRVCIRVMKYTSLLPLFNFVRTYIIH